MAILLSLQPPFAAGASAAAPAVADPALAASLQRIAGDAWKANIDLGVLVMDAEGGEVLFEHNADKPFNPASVTKVLTTAAALLTLDRAARVSTRVVAGNLPGAVVLVGGGDPTLSAAPPGEDTWYHGAARISDLVAQVRRSGVTPTAVQVDTSAFSGPTMAPG